jgi:hypothetical protein
MRKWLWSALLIVPLAAGGLGYAISQQTGTAPFICPLTGEELPCPKCCPLNQAGTEAFICPITGEELPCPKCCPLNQNK